MAYFTASCDPVETNKRFAESLDLDYPILSDPDKTVAKAFGVLSPRGFSSRVTVYVLKNGKVGLIDREVKASEDGKTVAASLAKLKVDKAKEK